MALTRVTSGGIAPGIVIKFDSNNAPTNPAVAFDNSNDTGTGMYQPANNEIAFSTAGVERLRIKSDGKVITGNGTVLGGTNPDFENASNIMLYVNQSDLNATDVDENTGGNVNRPFKTIERALIEAARRSYRAGTQDRFEAFTIMVMPGQYEIDNRPGYDIVGNPLTANTSDVVGVENGVYRFNSRNGGVVVPRGTSIVGYDLRKTVIRPKYVPTPATTTDTEEGSIINDGYALRSESYDGARMIERNRGYVQEQTSLYLLATNTTYQNINSAKKEKCKRDIGLLIDGIVDDLRNGGNENTFVLGESYTDGTNIKVSTLGNNNEVTATVSAFNYARDLMKKTVMNNWAGHSEYTTGKTISREIFAVGNGYEGNGDCTQVETAITTLTAVATTILSNPDTYTTLVDKTEGVYDQTAIFKVTGGCYFWQMTFKDALGTPYNSVEFDGDGFTTYTTAANSAYSHHRVVAFTYADQRTTDGELDQYYKKIDAWDQTIDGGNARVVRSEEYTIVGDGSSNTTIDTVNSCSPYVFNCSLRSVFGMCGMHTDGSKVAENSFKSMVVAQFTGISLQRDTNAFFQPKDLEGDNDNSSFNDENDNTAVPPVYADPDAQYKPAWRHFHIKASKGGFIQVVSVFAVGYADQFLVTSGGDQSITNSNSNFGQISLRAQGSQYRAFAPASQGRVTAVIPPRGISSTPADITFFNIASSETWEGIQQSDEVYVPTKESQYIGDAQQLRLYLEIGGISGVDDIPELIVETPDYNQTPVNGVYPTVTKRYLTYGTTNNYALFRDYYSIDGTVATSQRKIKTVVEGTDGNENNYFAKLSFDGTSAENLISGNSERQGYFFDSTRSKVYVKLDGTDSQTKSFISNFIFATKTEEVFGFQETLADDGSITTQFISTEREVLQYRDGFPAGLTTTKNVDARGSTPSNLLWRIEYSIPKNSTVIPKPPEKRFIIKGTRAGNGQDGMPYTDYRFMIWDVEEYQSWEKGVRDGVYYLTVIRADINRFSSGYSNTTDTIRRRTPQVGTPTFYDSSFVEEINLFNKETRLTGNVNYLYPSINEEGPSYETRLIWNPPQSDATVLVENIGDGNRVKDISVPNFYRYRGSASTPFKDIPAMYSMTAEAVHRLAQALDLRYAGAASASTRLKIAPVVSWDDRDGTEEYTSTVSSFNIYGSGSFRIGQNKNVEAVLDAGNNIDYNQYGIQEEPIGRRIIVVSPDASTINTESLSNFSVCPILPLYRPSILRASSHTWEYIGLGSGNYSTGFPQLQTRVLKPYEQFIAQGYENAGGFIASSGTNSAGDFYIGTQIIQAGGSQTVTLNVPKVRKSSESNYVEIENVENRIANSVVNVTASGANKNAASQNALKSLSNFFNAEKLSVSNIATINSLIVQEKLFISNNQINNAAFFPEGNTNAYGFVKAAKPEKTGFISTDTNDKLYVSPKYLDAWRVKRQLISAQAVTLDNNRVFLQPFTQSLLDSYNLSTGGYEALSVGIVQTAVTNNDDIVLYLKESSGIPSYGKIDIDMNLQYVDINDYYLSGGAKIYLNPRLALTLSYDRVDYTTNAVYIDKVQNNFQIVDYIKSCLGEYGKTDIVKSYTSFLQEGTFGVGASEGDIKYLNAKIAVGQSYTVSTLGSPEPDDTNTYKDIKVALTSAEHEMWPDRGAISLREYPKGGSYSVSTFAYYKSSNSGGVTTFVLFKKIGAGTNDTNSKTYTANYNNGYPGIDSKNVFFAGCNSIITFSDRWANESPFIPPIDPTAGAVEDINIEEATLYEIPQKAIPFAGNLDEDYIDTNLPNPYSSKALGVNLQTKNAVKQFSPLSYFYQAKDWADSAGFGPKDVLELLMKPGYYKLDGTSFPCTVKINGTGIADGGIDVGKERARVSGGKMGGYLEDTIKRGDSIYLYRAPTFRDQYGVGNDALYTDVSGGLTAEGGFDLSNLHFLGLNEAVTKNEIPDTLYSDDTKLQSARRTVRKAYYVKNFINLNYSSGQATSEKGSLQFTGNTSISAGKAELLFNIKSNDVVNDDLDSANYQELNSASASNARYMVIRLRADRFTGSAELKREFNWSRRYIIPGTTLYWLGTSDTINSLSKNTKVVSVRRINPSNAIEWDTTSTEEIQILVSLYQTESGNSGNNGTFTNSVEDLDIDSYTSGDKKLVFMNQDGAEFTTLTYNWAINRRRNFLPVGIVHEGGYQPAIIKRSTATAASGASTVTLDDIQLLKVGNRIVAQGIVNGTRIKSINTGTKTITLSDGDVTSAEIPTGTPFSFTQTNNFGDEITKYDIPEIYGILRGSEEAYISIVIDRNPNADIDSSISPYQFGPGSFATYPTQLIQLKDNHGSATTEYGSVEDSMVAVNRKKAFSKRVNGFSDNRFVFLDIAPEEILGISAGQADDPQNATGSIYTDNAGISKEILKDFAQYNNQTISFGGGIGTGFTAGTVSFGSNTTSKASIKTAMESAITAGGKKYNHYATAVLVPIGGATAGNLGAPRVLINSSTGEITGFNISGGTLTQGYNGSFNIVVTDRQGYILSPNTGRTVSLSSTNLQQDDFTIVCKQNLLSAFSLDDSGGGVASSPYLSNVDLDDDGDQDALTARGKKIYLSWPVSYRALRRRIPSAGGGAVNGNYQSSLINVNAIPGSNLPLNLSNVTIGAQSPASESANTFGGGYRGGLIRARGARLVLQGTRFRGNLSLDWTGLFSSSTSRRGGSFIAGHSIEMFQMEDQNEFSQIGGSRPAYVITTSKEDEEFRTLSEFNPESNIYLEPNKDPDGVLADGDGRTFPISTLQAIRRINKNSSAITPWDGQSAIDPGDLLDKVALFERFQAPYPIYYDDTSTTDPSTVSADANGSQYVLLDGGSTKASAIRLRWNDSGSTITSNTTASGVNIPKKELHFLYPADTASGQEIIDNTFVGKYATKIVKSTNIETVYATVTRVKTSTQRYTKDGTASGSGKYRLLRFQYSGSFGSISSADGNAVQINTNYLDAKRYNYISTVTSRYQKTTSGKNSKLILSVDNGVNKFAVHGDLAFGSGTITANLSKSDEYTLRNTTNPPGGTDGSTDGTVVVETDSSGNIVSLDILSFGGGHREDDKLAIFNGGTNLSSGIEIKARRNLDQDLSIFQDGEYKAILPRNCFVLNGISSPTVTRIKDKLIKARTIFKPGSYILLGNTYYRIANSDATNNTPYMGVYKYINPANTADQRADIVVMLEDPAYAPTYSQNQRFDLFDYDNLLDYWPAAGRMVIGRRETVDFVKSGDPTSNRGYELRVSRSMTKYWPHYIRDWEGLDPNDSSDSTVTVDTLSPTELRLADPVDVTCYGLKRISGDNNSIQEVDYDGSSTYITPIGQITNKITKIVIPSENVDTDFEKLSVGQVSTIPYRDISEGYNWSSVELTVGDQQGTKGESTSTNRAGDRFITGSLKSGISANVYYKHTYNIFPSGDTNSTEPWKYLSPLTAANISAPRSSVRQLHPGGFRTWGYLGTRTSAVANSGQNQITISAAYKRNMQRINSASEFTGSLAAIGAADPNERTLTVTAMTSGGISKGQPIYTNSGYSSGSLVGYVIGFEGDSINVSDGYEDAITLTGNGRDGVYRVQLADGATVPSGSITFYGQKISSDYFVYARNNCCWQRRVSSKVVNADNSTTITLNGNLNVPSGGTSGDASVFNGDYVLWYYYGYYDNAVKMVLDKPLETDIPEGKIFNIAPTPDHSSGTYQQRGKNSNNSFLFKSRILDVEKGTGAINVYLADPLPMHKWGESTIKNFGLVYFNHGGWTYPKTGGSSIRPNNVKLEANSVGSFSDKIYLPNRSGRIKPGDTLSYTWEDGLRVLSNDQNGGTITATSGSNQVTTSEDQRTTIYPGYLIYTSGAGDFIGTVSSVSETTITLTSNAETVFSGSNWKYTSTGKTISYSSQIAQVGAVDSNGYSECTISSGYKHILHDGFGGPSGNHKAIWYSVSDIFVSHRDGNFTKDGPVSRKFIYSDSGVKLTFGEYRIWYENFNNYVRAAENNTGQSMSGRQGWVGNFGLSSAGQSTIGLVMNGASSIQRGRQYESSFWLTAAPVHAKWESVDYSRRMIQCHVNSSTESDYAPTSVTNYDGAGGQQLSALNHTALSTGQIYASVNNGSYLGGGGDSYDTSQYQFLNTGTKLKYSLKNGIIDSATGNVSGGDSERLSEQFVIDQIVTYKPTLHNNYATTGSSLSVTLQSYNGSTYSNSSTGEYLSGTGIGNILIPGDVVYKTATPAQTSLIGVVKERVDDDHIKFGGIPNNSGGMTNDTNWSYISPKTNKAAGGNQALIYSGGGDTSTTDFNDINGGAGYNIVGENGLAGNRYNLKFNIARRTYNQTTLLNTYDQLKPIKSYSDVSKVIDIKFGDLNRYKSPLMNVEVTRLNPKTHIESSISVLNSNMHI